MLTALSLEDEGVVSVEGGTDPERLEKVTHFL